MGDVIAFSPSRKGEVSMLEMLVLGVREHQLQALILNSCSDVADCAIENMQRLIEEAKEAYRLLENRQRETNTYQVLHTR